MSTIFEGGGGVHCEHSLLWMDLEHFTLHLRILSLWFALRGKMVCWQILILTLKTAFPNMLRFMVCVLSIYAGFMFCGWVILGPYHIKVITTQAFSTLRWTFWFQGKRQKLSRFGHVTHHDSLSKSILQDTFRGWAMPWLAEEMLDGQHQTVDISAHARTAHEGLLQKRLEKDLCIIPCVSPMTVLVRGLNRTEQCYLKKNTVLFLPLLHC